MVQSRLFSYDDFIIHKEDALSLDNREWLTDNVLNFAVVYLANNLIQDERTRNEVSIVYATQCELIKYEDGSDLQTLLQNIGVTPDKWNIFLYNDSNNPEQIYSGSHWSLILFDPNNHRFWLIDPNLSIEIRSNIQLFAARMRDYMRVTTEPVINKYQRNPPMDNAGDCGVYVIEYARVILQAIAKNIHADPEQDFDFAESPYLGDRIQGIVRARKEWQRIINSLTDAETK